jgi:hypothetical protein
LLSDNARRRTNRKWLAWAFIQWLLVSVAIVILIGTLGIAWVHFLGPSKIAGASIILVA